MMRIFNKFSMLLMVCSIVIVSCSDDSKTDDIVTKDYDFSKILEQFVDHTIVPTYTEMKDNSKLLLVKVAEFEKSGSQVDLDAACEYWKTTRAPWEKGEAFLFGPAAYNNLDPLLDSWPLDKNQLDQVLDGNHDLTADFVRDGLGAVLRGFHTVEYLLFEDGAPRDVTKYTLREKQYLTAVSEVLRDDTLKLWALWDGGTSEKALLEDLGIEIGTPYGDEFKKAGNIGSRYLSQSDAVDEILQGMINIADEVANGKIADPHTSNNVLEVESWFSWNSLVDFQNNIRSIENSYLGGTTVATRKVSISTFVKEKNEALDTEIKGLITDAISAIDAIPSPFRNNLQASQVQTAMDAVNELKEIIETKVRPLIVN
ncbi:MAG: peptidase M75 [Flavobacteriaceae bacterium]|nr:MAG: peptidase M75 [Flavobacteriaceae bacterium]